MALGWGMKVIYHNRRELLPNDRPNDFEVEYRDTLEGFLKEADVVSLHLPVSLAIIGDSSNGSLTTADERKDQKSHECGAIQSDETR